MVPNRPRLSGPQPRARERPPRLATSGIPKRIRESSFLLAPRRLVRVLTFVDGKLKRKRTAGRGSLDDRDD